MATGVNLETGGINLGKLRMSELMGRFFAISCSHRVRLESDLTSIALTIMVL